MRSFRRQAETKQSGLCDDAGQRPLRLSDYDKAVLAIRDGELFTFKELYPKAMDHADDMLIETAGRPGAVGRKMILLLLADVEQFPETVCRAACQKAIDINDPEKVSFLLEQADSHVEDLPLSFCGEMASYAHTDHRFIAKQIIHQCTNEQIASAPLGAIRYGRGLSYLRYSRGERHFRQRQRSENAAHADL